MTPEELTSALERSIQSAREQKRCAAIGSQKQEAPGLTGPSASLSQQFTQVRGDQHTMNRELLEKPFAPEQIKQRQGGYGEVLDYIEGPTVIQRLNDAFQSEWSFRVTEHTILENEVVVLGELTAHGITKTQFGAKDITRAKADGKDVSLGDDLKAATTDALKKCATLFGVGLHLYFDEVPRPAPAPTPPGNGNGYSAGNENARVSARQLSAIFGIAKGRNWSHAETREFTKSMFGKLPDFLTMREASAVIDHLQAGGRA